MDGNSPRLQNDDDVRSEVLDTWHTSGMRDAGSNDLRAANLGSFSGHSFKFGSPTKRAGPLYSHPLDFLAKFYGVPLGLARAAIGQFCETMQTKIELPSQRPYKNTSRVQTAIGEAEMMLGAAHSYPYLALERHWRRLDAREPMTEKDAADLALSRVNSAQAARQTIRSLYDPIGSAIYAERGLSIGGFGCLPRDWNRG